MNFSPLSLSEVARRRRALQPFWSPPLADLSTQREQHDEEREEGQA